MYGNVRPASPVARVGADRTPDLVDPFEDHLVRADVQAWTPISVDPQRLCTGAPHAASMKSRSSAVSGSELAPISMQRIRPRPGPRR